jgi:hypothetical protein
VSPNELTTDEKWFAIEELLTQREGPPGGAADRDKSSSWWAQIRDEPRIAAYRAEVDLCTTDELRERFKEIVAGFELGNRTPIVWVPCEGVRGFEVAG